MQEAGNEYAPVLRRRVHSQWRVARAVRRADVGTRTLIKNKGSAPTISHKLDCLKQHVLDLLRKIQKCNDLHQFI